jgi:hypothetical protein
MLKYFSAKKHQARAERGYALFAVMVIVSIVTVWIANAALTAGYGLLAAAGTRNRLDARIAANERVSGAVPEGAGGSVWPAEPVAGFHDYLVADDATGRLRVLEEDEVAGAGEAILRQWRIAPNAAGGRVFEVSTVIVDARTGAAVRGPRGGEFRRSEIVE